MSYCRFRNTLNDLWDCYEHLADVENGESEERDARDRLVALCQKIVDRAREWGIVEA